MFPYKHLRPIIASALFAGVLILASQATPIPLEKEVPPPEIKQEQIAALSVAEMKPRVTKRILPEYPELARKERIQGTVLVRVLVDEEGKVVRIGQIRGQAVFRDAVREAMQKWEFAPARQGGLAVRAWVVQPLCFEM